MNEELLKFIIKGDLEAVEKMLPATDVHERNEHGGTYLMYAIYSNRIPVARVLIEAGSDINAKDKYGHSVIQGAALQGHLEAAYLLYTYGVKIDLREPLFKKSNGETVCTNGSFSCSSSQKNESLKKYGPRRNIRTFLYTRL